MARRKETFVDLLIMAPWWVSVFVAIVSYILVGIVLPAKLNESQALSLIADQIKSYAPLVPLFFLFIAGISYYFGFKKKALVEKQTSLESLKALSWKEFEWMVGEAYRRQGYTVEDSLDRGPDGGVDLVLRKDERKILVQCKRWKTRSVGAPIVREQYGILNAENADEVIIVASGKFTREAINFAEGKPITLVDGKQLLRLLAGVQRSGAVDSKSETGPGAVPDCPKCGELMVLRTAKKGKNSGKQFWGCSKFPKCRGTLPTN